MRMVRMGFVHYSMSLINLPLRQRLLVGRVKEYLPGDDTFTPPCGVVVVVCVERFVVGVDVGDSIRKSCR